ncbi:hypothetical protein, partial [Halomonas sp. BC04]|uniref:hypothetical protein n=1 Tax=Halomonas sp. BC04 TaxID=1403540 RepID=UPI001E49FF21
KVFLSQHLVVPQSSVDGRELIVFSHTLVNIASLAWREAFSAISTIRSCFFSKAAFTWVERLDRHKRHQPSSIRNAGKMREIIE